MTELTRLLHQVESGAADEATIAAIYDELRRLARGQLRGERGDHTLAPTALANEAWLRMFGGDPAAFTSGREFFAAAATTLRRILVEHHRRRARHKRGGGAQRAELDVDAIAAPSRDDRLLALDAALERLAALDPQKARLVELRFFAGMSVEEVARLLSLSERTAAREWRAARAFLRADLGGDEESDDLDA